MLSNTQTIYEIRKILTDYYNSSIVNLVMSVFLEYEAPDYSQEGIDTFSAYVNDENVMRNLDMYGAFIDDEVVGIIAARNGGKHISLFFVDSKYHRKGIGKMLFSAFIKDNPAKVITVNSSPYAVEIYRKLGFVDTDTEQIQDGIRYTPMKYIK